MSNHFMVQELEYLYRLSACQNSLGFCPSSAKLLIEKQRIKQVLKFHNEAAGGGGTSRKRTYLPAKYMLSTIESCKFALCAASLLKLSFQMTGHRLLASTGATVVIIGILEPMVYLIRSFSFLQVSNGVLQFCH